MVHYRLLSPTNQKALTEERRNCIAVLAVRTPGELKVESIHKISTLGRTIARNHKHTNEVNVCTDKPIPNMTTTTTSEKKEIVGGNHELSIPGNAATLSGTSSKVVQVVGAASPNRDFRFPEVLHAMLKDVEKNGLSHIVSWQPHGRCVKVHQPREFVDKILHRWFHQTKWASFQRQLSIYGFLRITSGPDKNAYYHPLFLRGQEALTREIPRVSVKGTGHRQRPAATQKEPNFYVMPPLPTPSEDPPSQNHSTTNHITYDSDQRLLGPTCISRGIHDVSLSHRDLLDTLSPNHVSLFNSLTSLRDQAGSLPPLTTTGTIDPPLNLSRQTLRGSTSPLDIPSLLAQLSTTNASHSSATTTLTTTGPSTDAIVAKLLGRSSSSPSTWQRLAYPIPSLPSPVYEANNWQQMPSIPLNMGEGNVDLHSLLEQLRRDAFLRASMNVFLQ